MLDNWLHGLGNGPNVLENGPHVLGIMSHSALCRIRDYVTFGIMSHLGLCCSVLCRSGLCRIRGYVIQYNVAFSIMLHLA